MGIFIKCNPLLNKLAAKPPTSPVIPPPIANKLSSLEKFLFSKISKIEFIVVWFLFFSLALKLNKNNFPFAKDFKRLINPENNIYHHLGVYIYKVEILKKFIPKIIQTR